MVSQFAKYLIYEFKFYKSKEKTNLSIMSLELYYECFVLICKKNKNMEELLTFFEISLEIKKNILTDLNFKSKIDYFIKIFLVS
jgi:hypothetical protein